MKLHEWKKWFRSLGWNRKWFVLLVLLRPIIDLFYFLKEISPFLSPLYLVGVFIPIAILFSFSSSGFSQKSPNRIHNRFVFWSILCFINIGLFLMFNPYLSTFGEVIKFSTPLLLFFYLRRFIRHTGDLFGILQSFLYSIIVPLLIAPFQSLFNPEAYEYVSKARGAGTRFSGGYADIMNYGTFIVVGVLILGYFFLKKDNSLWARRKSMKILVGSLLIAVMGLVFIRHTASWGVFFVLVAWLMINLLLSREGKSIAFIFLVLFGLFGQVVFESQINPLIEREIQVLEGEEIIDRSFNGRMQRWVRVLKVWNRLGFLSHVLGVPFEYLFTGRVDSLIHPNASPKNYIPSMIGGGIHSDYFRVLYLSGIVGFAAYLWFLWAIWVKARRKDKANRFLIIGALLIVFFYSLSAHPLMYQLLMNPILAVFAFASLNLNRVRRIRKLEMSHAR